MECLVLHEHHVSYFETAHEILNRGAEVATTSPNILDERDIVRVNSERLSQPTVVELDALVLEKLIVIRLVKHLDAEHDKAGVVAPSQANVVQIVEASAELRADERVGRRVEFTSYAVGLEAEDASSDVIDIVPPACHNRVALDGVAGDASRSQACLKSYQHEHTRKVCKLVESLRRRDNSPISNSNSAMLLTLPSLSKCDLISIASSVANERVLALTATVDVRTLSGLYLLRVTASCALLSVPPVVISASVDGATRSVVAQILEHGRRVELLGVRLELRTGQSFDFLSPWTHKLVAAVIHLPWS